MAAAPRSARVFIRPEDFDLGREVALLREGDGGIGAVVSFVGSVRDRHDGAVLDALELEHYPGMTEASIEAMIDEATRRFEICAARVVHRVGRLEPLAQIVLVAVAASHRGQAFQACEFLMDYLKTQAPFWKKESGPAGARWVDARSADDDALARWGIAATNTVDAATNTADAAATASKTDKADKADKAADTTDTADTAHASDPSSAPGTSLAKDPSRR